jgi:hypothetical protein
MTWSEIGRNNGKTEYFLNLKNTMNKKYIPKEISWLSFNERVCRRLKTKRCLFLKGSSFWVSIPIILMNTSE